MHHSITFYLCWPVYEHGFENWCTTRYTREAGLQHVWILWILSWKLLQNMQSMEDSHYGKPKVVIRGSSIEMCNRMLHLVSSELKLPSRIIGHVTGRCFWPIRGFRAQQWSSCSLYSHVHSEWEMVHMVFLLMDWEGKTNLVIGEFASMTSETMYTDWVGSPGNVCSSSWLCPCNWVFVVIVSRALLSSQGRLCAGQNSVIMGKLVS